MGEDKDCRQRTPPTWKERELYAFLWRAAFALIFGAAYGWFSLKACREEARVTALWREHTGLSWTAVKNAPHGRANATARELVRLFSFEGAFHGPDGQRVWNNCMSILWEQLQENRDEIAPLPDDVRDYLAVHRNDFLAMNQRIVSLPPVWSPFASGAALSRNRQAVKQYLYVAALYVLSALGDGGRDQALAWMEAMWRCGDCRQINSALLCALLLARLHDPPEEWQRRLATPDDSRGLLSRRIAASAYAVMNDARETADIANSFFDIPSVLPPLLKAAIAAAGRPYFRLCAADLAGISCQAYLCAEAADALEADLPPALESVEHEALLNPLYPYGVHWSGYWRSIRRKELKLESILKVIHVKGLWREAGKLPDALAPLASSVCPQFHWEYVLESENSFSLTLDGKPSWVVEIRHGSAKEPIHTTWTVGTS